MLGQQPLVKNREISVTQIIGLDEDDTLYVQKGYIVMVLIRYKVVHARIFRL